MNRIFQAFVFLLLLGPTAFQERHLYVGPHAPAASFLTADTSELTGTSELPLQPALLAGTQAVRIVLHADGAALLSNIATPQANAAKPAAIAETCLLARSVPATVLGRAPPPILS